MKPYVVLQKNETYDVGIGRADRRATGLASAMDSTENKMGDTFDYGIYFCDTLEDVTTLIRELMSRHPYNSYVSGTITDIYSRQPGEINHAKITPAGVLPA